MEGTQVSSAADALPNNGVEYDENGVPYYKWPPFPQPPPGVNVMPFEDFRANGIQINMDADAIELDGLGIPTVQLKVKHDPSALPKKKKKHTVPLGGTAVKKSTWYEDWAEGEDLRSSHDYSRIVSREDRLLQASEDFRMHRHWPPFASGIHALYDHFRIFIGLIGNPMRGVYRKNPGEDDIDDDEDDDENEPTGEDEMPQMARESEVIIDKPKRRRPINEPELDYEPVEEEFTLEDKEVRLGLFLDNLETTMKIFFSSYFRDKGLLWVVSHLRDSPILASFYLNFLVRNRALPEYEKDLKKAIEVVEQAKKQLPLTKQISNALPDELAKACTELFGSRIKPITWSDNFDLHKDLDEEQPKSKRARTGASADEDDTEMTVEASIGEVPVESNENMDVDKVATARAPEEAGNAMDLDVSIEEIAAATTMATEQSSTNSTTTAAGWGGIKPQLIREDSSWAAGGGGGWTSGTEKVEWTGTLDENAWSKSDEPWPEPLKYFLMSFTGPSTFPLRNTTGYAERSTRKIISWSGPETKANFGASDDLRSQFAVIVLAPWKDWSSEERAAVKEPEVSPPSRDADMERLRVHDAKKDNIILLANPKIVEHLCVGMGIGGTFVQVVSRVNQESKANSTSSASIGSGSRPDRRGVGNHRKGGGNNKDRGSTSARIESNEQPWWYIEQLEQVLPSYWTERSVFAK